ncbi:tRNA (5-methylaminomethyl-2-thiouridine)(34)-methyltransferase MnmD [Tamlana sp. 2201CG12-4]|uniref:tRNA (5-methylaminomethyl-2-thiouridine)(34)-methyltransferase MnmD n=1 Tax=Tamlana sp. 2201CG12-4 TaxID=3112582 RepID=UPI002DBFE323|nr:tRNA (5-methylaminomethyl-2-thiouridine)(34)-methyltransferase MnmD [Tamlana sp. 2201CG12-4]MEC3907562.1 tRNA (5-methylaminomethyl-2-thiouridine)(34)-methyltransferase MnmD [Tamlana sp. 2201CG12-4]
MKREIIITSDGSSTIHLPDWNEQYHSKHGAIQEAYHVFIKHGLYHFLETVLISEPSEEHPKATILEIGFGTGLNAFITLLESEKINKKIDYTGVEGYPVLMDEVKQLNYSSELQTDKSELFFHKIHSIPWEEKNEITGQFTLTKQKKFFSEIDDESKYHIIYFDAFGARVQPELWTEAVFEKMYNALKPGGILVTYSAKGSVRRAMLSVGFAVEKLPGPPGKREMLRAQK